MLISEKSLTITAMRRPPRLASRSFSSVVLPEPRNPDNTVTGVALAAGAGATEEAGAALATGAGADAALAATGAGAVAGALPRRGASAVGVASEGVRADE